MKGDLTLKGYLFQSQLYQITLFKQFWPPKNPLDFYSIFPDKR